MLIVKVSSTISSCFYLLDQYIEYCVYTTGIDKYDINWSRINRLNY